MARVAMADEPNARPVSGEIMAGGSSGPSQRMRADAALDIIDADFTSAHAAPWAATAAPPKPAEAEPPPDAAGMASLRRSGGLTRGSGAGFQMFGLSLAAFAFWAAGGHALMPQTWLQAEPLAMVGLSSRLDRSGASPLLVVEGYAVNRSAASLPMRELAIRVTAADGAASLYRVGSSGGAIAPGGRFAFASRVPAPKNGVSTVSVAWSD